MGGIASAVPDELARLVRAADVRDPRVLAAIESVVEQLGEVGERLEAIRAVLAAQLPAR